MEAGRFPTLTDGVDVRRQRAQRAAAVLLDALWRVKLGDVIIGVDSNQDVGDKRLQEKFKSELETREKQAGSRQGSSFTLT